MPAQPLHIDERSSSRMQKTGAEDTITVPVPDHRELRTGTLLSIIRQSGLPRSEFEHRDGSRGN